MPEVFRLYGVHEEVSFILKLYPDYPAVLFIPFPADVPQGFQPLHEPRGREDLYAQRGGYVSYSGRFAPPEKLQQIDLLVPQAESFDKASLKVVDGAEAPVQEVVGVLAGNQPGVL